MPDDKYLEELYDITFNSVYDALAEMACKDYHWAVQHIRAVLKTLYVNQGNNWSGRGVVGDTSIDASVAAHEAILAELTCRRKQQRG